MAVLKCTVCGGDLEVNEESTVGICKYCDSVITIPKELDRKGNLYNRATFLRHNNEFDKAISAYEEILKEDNLDAEAHWGLVLSKFGIEYVNDPKTGTKIPTCHRVQSTSILADPDYLEALKNFEPGARRVVEKEAKRISEIQKGILAISEKEPPYDVFICYKETDDDGKRTEDSVIAYDLYFELEKKGYRVFFARKTLESKLGAEYEPIIFAALNTAKVMVVLGTKVEYFNAVWVRNEWSRFLKMSVESSKTIIPVYRGMSPYELPVELSGLQSLDMSKIAFMQDLSDGIERCIRKTPISAKKEFIPNAETHLDRLIKNGMTYLRLKNYEAAEETYGSITKEYPEDYRGWWGLIICKTKDLENVMLDRSILNIWFGYVKQLAEPDEFDEIEKKYVEYTQKVSLLAADEDMNCVRSAMIKSSKTISQCEQLIETEKSNMETKEKDFTEYHAERVAEISKYNKSIRTYEKLLAKRKRRVRFTFFLVCGGILMLSGGVSLELIGLVVGGLVALCGAMFFGVAGDGESKEEIQEQLTKLQNALRERLDLKESEQKEYESVMQEHANRIEEYKRNISTMQVKIKNCQQYLDLGKEQITSYWFAEECEEIGVERKCDEVIREYRKHAYSVQ